MADIIRLTVSEVEAAAAKFNQAASETEQMVTNLSREVEGLASGWEGDAYNAFTGNFANIATQMKDIVAMYEGLDAQLKQVAKTIQETDSSIASALNGG